MSILLIYDASAVKTQQIEVRNPSLETYLELQNTYDTNVKCPCTEISALYGSFVKIIPVYHEICSSDFVSQQWIDMLFNDQTSMRYVLDFRATASQQFQILRELCTFSQTATNNDIQGLYDDELISAYLLSENLLKAEVVSITTAFRTSSIADFLRSLSFVREYVLGNQFMTGIQTGYMATLYSDYGLNWYGTQGTPTFEKHGTVDKLTTTQTWKQRAQTLVKRVRNSLIDLNLFKSSLRQQPTDIKQQLWTTRIYITLLIIALAILTLYGILSFEIKLIQVNKPSFSTVQQLRSQSQTNLISSLQCPCTNLTATYSEFIELQPFYHQVCSSDFVSERWIDAFGDMRAHLSPRYVQFAANSDFSFAQPLFLLLEGLCNFSNETVTNSLQTFEQNQLVGTQLLSVTEFTEQMSSVISIFELETKSPFLHFLELLRNITHVNQIVSAAGSNFYINITGPPNFTTSLSIMTYNDDNSSNICSCANDSSCKMNWGLFIGNPADTQVYTIPELYFACQPVESLLQSTLKCFYDDQDCLSTIINFYNVSSFNNFTRLNSSSHASRFMINSTIGSLLSEMFIESWSESTNYSSYFDQCQPSSCSYTIPQRNSLLETITRIVGLIGGLSVSLRILVPFIVMACMGVIRRLWSQHQPALTEATRPLSHFMRVGNKIRDGLQKVNVFEDTNRTVTIQQQCVATRVYLLLLVLSLFIVVLYTSITYYLNTFTITKPSLEQYQQLQQRYGSEAVSCPCSRLSITHSTFITLQCEFHPVCTSPFTSDSYLQELFQLYNDLDSTYATTNAFTLQGTIFSHFQALRALCNLVQDFVNDAQQQYLVSSMISTLMIDLDLFKKETNASLSDFQLTLPNSFNNSLQMIRGLMQGNGFVSAYSTNWYYITKNIVQYGMLYLKPQYYGNDMCNCATSSTCTQSSTPYIKGYLVGCTPLESLLQSTLECLYEPSCIDLLTTYLNMSLSNHLVPLNKSETRFSSDDTVNSIVQQMFVETCSSNVSFNQFFEECKPDYCSVTLLETDSFIIVITTILGLYGGLTTFLKLVVPFLVFSTYKLVRKYKQRAQVGIQQFLQQAQPQQPVPTQLSLLAR
ncbi:unnamed protein product [Adineta steineri]|uniref:Uncharacterized protein n=1 Tax=Adineta steineri TaxID=433720 RepID=A0A819H383_9BILA|nr:unnamed protein product [Adineta steineri]